MRHTSSLTSLCVVQNIRLPSILHLVDKNSFLNSYLNMLNIRNTKRHNWLFSVGLRSSSCGTSVEEHLFPVLRCGQASVSWPVSGCGWTRRIWIIPICPSAPMRCSTVGHYLSLTWAAWSPRTVWWGWTSCVTTLYNDITGWSLPESPLYPPTYDHMLFNWLHSGI